MRAVCAAPDVSAAGGCVVCAVSDCTTSDCTVSGAGDEDGCDGFLPQAETTAITQNTANNPESSFLFEGFLSLNLSFSIFLTFQGRHLPPSLSVLFHYNSSPPLNIHTKSILLQ